MNLDSQNFLETIVDMAKETEKHINGDFGQVQAIVDGSELVFAVWQDKNKPSGYDAMLIKGAQNLREISAGGSASARRLAAIPCVSAEHAETLRQVAGEKDQRH